MISLRNIIILLILTSLMSCGIDNGDNIPSSAKKIKFENTWQKLIKSDTIYGDNPDWVVPIVDEQRFRGKPLINQNNSNISIKSWRYSFNKRGIIEFENKIDGSKTAVVIIHPWGIDGSSNWKTPEPNGTVLFCTPEKNSKYNRHVNEVLVPFLDRFREKVAFSVIDMPNDLDSIRANLYPSIYKIPTKEEKLKAEIELEEQLNNHIYKGDELPNQLLLNSLSTQSYFKEFRGLFMEEFNGEGFGDLPVPVHNSLKVTDKDIVVYDNQDYNKIKDFLKNKGIKNIIMMGYATDFCLKLGVVGYKNIREDFNLFIVGDATMATFPAMTEPKYATTVELSRISSYHMMTQISWIKEIEE